MAASPAARTAFSANVIKTFFKCRFLPAGAPPGAPNSALTRPAPKAIRRAMKTTATIIAGICIIG
ncbi:hypothetical protein N1F89_13150 [Aquibium sp. A9E412]|uniref:hypothetical protein n=1 Tax=Aquibium sp. A9E412 TaxID=2976767 RepID=UPI0025B1BB75|nr:hypothetical protein [Aquibium sp. A9E412]MDN2567169.1 hypothetical protein [Aquibium sp. A9E412]